MQNKRLKIALRKHGVYFIETVFSIIVGHLLIKYFFHVPEIVEFRPIYIAVLLLVFIAWLYGFLRDLNSIEGT